MKYILLSFCFLCLGINNAQGKITCWTDSVGVENCSGKDENGNTVKTRTRTDSTGRKVTTGKVGNEKVDIKSRTDSVGRTKSTGKIGDKRVDMTSSTDSIGYEKTTGKIGDEKVKFKSRKDSTGRVHYNNF